MGVTELLRWQWAGYPRVHRSHTNLLIHIVVVPLFLLGNVSLVVALLSRSWFLGAVSLVIMVVSVALQGRGHKQEQVPPEPFTGPTNAISRIFLEQWVTFPRFVLSGEWLRALRQ
ncbi:MAG: DUF962 domain-containing protein [Acidobacteria bacterium]|nr:DUF962 domain-containing protein [Acidobacteriota bacterium]